MNWILGNNEVKKYEQITSRQSHLGKGFKVKDKDDKESTHIDIGFIRHMQQRDGNPIAGNGVEEATSEAKKNAKDEAAELYKTITKSEHPEDKSVKDSAHTIAGGIPRFLRGARQLTADVAKIVSGLALCSIPHIGGCLFAFDIAQNTAPKFFKAEEYPSPLKLMRDAIDNCIVGDKLGMSDIREDALDTAHKAVAQSFTKSDNKAAIEEALNADKAAILGLPADHFVIQRLNDISKEAEIAEIDSTQEETESTENLSAVDRVKAEKEAEAKKAEAEEKHKSAKEEAENLVVEKRLLAVRALTEKTDLHGILRKDTKDTDDKTNLDKFLELKPAQMKQVLEAFHLKHFDPKDPKKYKTPDEMTAAAKGKFDEAIELVKQSADQEGQVENGKNALGDTLWKHETGGALRIGKMVGRSIGEKMWSVGSTLRKMKPQVAAVGSVAVAMAAHYALGKADLGSMGRAAEKVVGQGTHFQPTTS